jgi:hypothetical protein
MRVLLLAVLAVLAGIHPASAQVLSYQLTIAGRTAGSMEVNRHRSSERRITYRYIDRGRGPDVVSEVRLDAALRPLSLSVQGHDYFKVPVDERFSRVGAVATWTSLPDEGSSSSPGFYLPNEMAPEHLAMLARALLKTSDRTLQLIPAGRVRLKLGPTHRLKGGTQARLYLIEGLDFRPVPIWLDEASELVSEGDTWMQTVRRGMEADAADLAKLQESVISGREREQARRLQRRPAGGILIRNVRLFDAEAKQMRPNMSVFIHGNRIAAVRRRIAAPPGAEVVDGAGKTLLPGLWDMHVHLSRNSSGLLHLAAGVTSVRDMAMDMEELLERRGRFERGELLGPRVVLAGFLDGPGPLAAPSKALVDTPEEVREWIDRYADAGYSQIKLYSSLDPKLVPVAIERARARGLRVSGHVPAKMTMEEAVRLGFDEVQHANYWFLNFMGPEVAAKTAGMTRFLAVAERGYSIDLASPEVSRLIALLKERGTVVDPTLLIFEGMFLSQPRKPATSLAAVVDRLPPVVRRGFYARGLAKSGEQRARYAASFAKMKEMLGLLYRNGIRIVPGTDAETGFAYHRELELYTEAGIPPLEVLHMATLAPARLMKRDRELGSIAPGKLADLVLVEGDPAARMSDIRRTALVIKDGALLRPGELHAAVGVTPSL